LTGNRGAGEPESRWRGAGKPENRCRRAEGPALSPGDRSRPRRKVVSAPRRAPGPEDLRFFFCRKARPSRLPTHSEVALCDLGSTLSFPRLFLEKVAAKTQGATFELIESVISARFRFDWNNCIERKKLGGYFSSSYPSSSKSSSSSSSYSSSSSSSSYSSSAGRGRALFQRYVRRAM
jgi:hypothetical protein